jgi:hypothetical protein
MEPSPPSPPRTLIVIDDNPNNVSFIRSVLEAHALPYEVQVIDHRDDAVAVLHHCTQHASPQAPTLLLRHRQRPLREGTALWRRLKALWPAWTLPRMRMPMTQHHPAAYPRRPPRRQWPRRLAWGVGVGLLAGLLCSAPALWLSDRRPRVPSSPPPHSDHMAAAPAVPPVAEAHPPLPSQTPPEHAPITSVAPGSIPASVPPQQPKASVARNAVPRRPQVAAPRHAARAEDPQSARGRSAALRAVLARHPVNARDTAGTSTRPHDVEHERVEGAHRPGASVVASPAPQPSWGQLAPDPAPEMARPWERRSLNDSGA